MNKYYTTDGIFEAYNAKEEWIIHRVNGPAIEYEDGSQYWIVNGEFHREDGPAVIDVDGNKEWWVNGNLHRENGPAVEYNNGYTKYCKYYLNGIELTEEQYKSHFVNKNNTIVKKPVSKFLSVSWSIKNNKYKVKVQVGKLLLSPKIINKKTYYSSEKEAAIVSIELMLYIQSIVGYNIFEKHIKNNRLELIKQLHINVGK